MYDALSLTDRHVYIFLPVREMNAASTESGTAGATAACTRLRCYFDGQSFFLWDAFQAYVLRCAHRIVGNFIGALPTNKRQNAEFGLPLSLLFEEVLLAVEEGFIDVVDVSAELEGSRDTGASTTAAATTTAATTTLALISSDLLDNRSSRPLPLLTPEQVRLTGGSRLAHARVYRALWERGLFVTLGSAFGSDYLCYPADPMRHHAHMMVQVALAGRAPRAVELACFARLAGSVKKGAYLALVTEPSDGTPSGVRLEPIQVKGAGTLHLSSCAVTESASTLQRMAATALGAADRAQGHSSIFSHLEREFVTPASVSEVPAALVLASAVPSTTGSARQLVQYSHALVEEAAWIGDVWDRVLPDKRRRVGQ
jgi:tRNA-splicing endonuclease subunit Sen34